MSLKSIIRATIRPGLRRLGYDICSAEAVRDPFEDMKRNLGERPRIFDVGANVGDVTIAFRDNFPDCEIHAFEPGTEAFDALRLRCSTMPNVTLNNIALGSRAGDREFIENKATVMSSFLETGSEGFGEISHRKPVRVETLDSYCRTRKIDTIDLIKSDTQGFDLEVLRGAKDMMRATRLIFIEITFIELYKNLPPPYEIFRFLDECHFSLLSFYHPAYRGGRLGWADALFINRKPV